MKRQIPHESGNMPDTFDLKLGELSGIGLRTKPSTIIVVQPLVGNAETFIVQTVHQAEEEIGGDWLFVQHITGKRTTRIAMPPKVTAIIASQHQALVRRRLRQRAKRVAQERKANGFVPFVKKAANAGKGKE